jgi:hypothetical protein
MGAPNVKQSVMDVFMRHANQHVSITTLQTESGKDRQQVLGAISQLVNRDNVNIKPVVRGAAYVYRDGPVEKPTEPIFRQVGQTKLGVSILEDEEGDLWKAERI